MTTISIFILIISFVLLIGLLYKSNKDGKKEIIRDMFKNGDIDSKTYEKYLKKFW